MKICAESLKGLYYFSCAETLTSDYRGIQGCASEKCTGKNLKLVPFYVTLSPFYSVLYLETIRLKTFTLHDMILIPQKRHDMTDMLKITNSKSLSYFL